MSKWYVLCDVCGRKIYNVDSYKRWDGMIVCPNDYESKHPSLTYRPKVGGGGAIPAGSIGTTGDEDTSQSILVCDVYTSMGVVGYGTTGCAQVGSYNLAFSPLPSTTGPTGPENPIVVPGIVEPPLDLIWLAHFDDGDGVVHIVDDTGFVWQNASEWGAVTTAAVHKFGTCAVGTDSVSDQMNMPHNITIPSAITSFCLEGWVFLFASQTRDIFIGNFNGGGGNIYLKFVATTKTWSAKIAGLTGSTFIFDSINTWYHVAATYDGTDLRLFIDGDLKRSNNSVGQSLAAGTYTGSIITTPTFIGGTSNCLLDECRFVANNAVYTSNFTPPTAAYPSGIRFGTD